MIRIRIAGIRRTTRSIISGIMVIVDVIFAVESCIMRPIVITNATGNVTVPIISRKTTN